MNESMKLIQNILTEVLKNIESGRIYITDKQVDRVSCFLNHLFCPTMTRLEVLDELGICDTTFRKKIKEGKIPKGKKIRGITTHKWSKRDIESIVM